MKKWNTKSFLTGVVLTALVMGLCVPAVAAAIQKQLTVTYKDIKICVDGTEITPKDANGNTVEPFVSGGTTYLPVRAVGEALGKEVTWDGNTNTVYVGAKPNNSSEKTSNIGDYAVTIDGARLSEDYEGNPAIIVTYTWTNNGTETESALLALSAKAYQNGVQLDTAMMSSASGYESNALTELKPGATVTVQSAFLLNDSTSQVEVDISEAFAISDSGTISQTFDITAL